MFFCLPADFSNLYRYFCLTTSISTTTSCFCVFRYRQYSHKCYSLTAKKNFQLIEKIYEPRQKSNTQTRALSSQSLTFLTTHASICQPFHSLQCLSRSQNQKKKLTNSFMEYRISLNLILMLTTLFISRNFFGPENLNIKKLHENMF